MGELRELISEDVQRFPAIGLRDRHHENAFVPHVYNSLP